jgi:hypothetical protein
MFTLQRKRNNGVVRFPTMERTARWRPTMVGRMLTIRILLRRHGYALDHCSDAEIVEALVKVSGETSDVGLSARHLIAAGEHLTSREG